jgi:predicted transcriptional regulator
MSTVNRGMDGALDPVTLWNHAARNGNGAARVRRTEIELVVEVLLCLDRGIGQTSALLRTANLTHGKLSTILSQLEERQLISSHWEDGHNVYRIETRGRELLAEYLSFRRLLERTYGFSV